MPVNEREKLAAPCGIDCGICELYLSGSNEKLMGYLVTKGIPKEKLPCAGCRNIGGNCPVIGETCVTFTCASEKSVEFCFECKDFPCSMLNPAADRADVLPHNTKVFNLCTIKRDGVEGFVKISGDIKKKYYQGKMAVGRGPQLPA